MDEFNILNIPKKQETLNLKATDIKSLSNKIRFLSDDDIRKMDDKYVIIIILV